MTTAPVTASSTPAEIDGQLLRLWSEQAHYQARLMAEKITDADAADATAALVTLRALAAPLEQAYAERRWTRWYWVPGGHLHREGECPTLYASTDRKLTAADSGLNDAELVAKRGWNVCTVCVKGAPLMPGFRTPGTAAINEAAADGYCINTLPSWEAKRSRWHGYASCDTCKAGAVAVTSRGNLRKHKHQLLADAAERKARLEDPKKIGTANGDELRVAGWVIASRRTAESKWVSYMEDADPRGWTSNPSYQDDCRKHARQIAEALAAKDGVTVEVIEARLQPKVEARVLKFLRDRARVNAGQ
ncbi:hypothetical protein JNW90_24210 [Micromonospora sp. STR1s_5]|nr:hypothetical protein [Micromonospora sp. STR1s_5]